jgi:cysteine desulfurase / selenocysteine lyase
MDKNIKKDFPQFQRKIHKKPIVYLDSSATSLKPQCVLDAMNKYYSYYTANVFRGIYTTSEEATEAYEQVRSSVAKFIGVRDSREIVFTRNTSESINLVAYSAIKHDDEIVTTIMEHHSNFVPWQQMREKSKFKVWDIQEDGTLDLDDLEYLITSKTKLLAVTALSNVLGTINPITKIVRTVKRLNPKCLVLVDAAQAAPHMKLNMKEWGADFVAFSSHKMLGPTGIGVLWGRYELLEQMKPYMYGGDMISEVYLDHTVFKPAPHKFEAGTPHIAGVIGLGAAIEYLSSLDMDTIRKHEEELCRYTINRFNDIKGLTYVGPKKSEFRGGVFAFTLDKAHPHDIAQLLNEDNIFIRAGNHCAMPLHERLGIASTARASFYIYTTKSDIDMLIEGLFKVRKIFS